ncbi:hypothetical protein V5O48_006770 [Marasmius crinis-equi]|uniref:Uncharacterized protein n=1 Tax=Marasmius crinis-equi TaxID=585013 RepID=A0ABR3FII8_9AGAR
MSSSLNKADWRKPTITATRSQRIQVAQSAIEKALSNLRGDGLFSTSFYASAVLYSDMAEFDFVSNGTRYKDQLARFLQLRAEETLASNSTRVCLFPLFLFPLPPNDNSHVPIQATQDLLELGHAAIRAYAAYRDNVFLGLAIDWWQWARAWTVSDSASSSHTAPGKSAPLPSSCSGLPIVGGTFQDTGPTNSHVQTLPTGNFLVLSSLLSEATLNQTYLDQATQTFYFFQRLLLDTMTTIPQESIFLNASDTKLCSTDPPAASYCSGIWIEGLATFSRVADRSSKPDEQL